VSISGHRPLTLATMSVSYPHNFIVLAAVPKLHFYESEVCNDDPLGIDEVHTYGNAN
jgi:hypothetical protein